MPAGMVGDLRRMITKSNQEMVDSYYRRLLRCNNCDCILYYEGMLENDAIVAIKGTLSFKEDSIQILVNKVTEIERISEFKDQGRNDYNRTSMRNYSFVKTELLCEKQYLKLRVSQELSGYWK